MWEINNLHQWLTFLYCIITGFGLSIFYDLFRLDRMIFHRAKITEFFKDIVFWTISAFVTFCLMLLRTNGQIRMFVFFGLIIGFFTARLTVSRFIMYAFKPLKRLIYKLRNGYRNIIEKLSGWLLNIRLKGYEKGRDKQINKKLEKN